jgi:hypothetical protein
MKHATVTALIWRIQSQLATVAMALDGRFFG